jgi:hypothetical protein
MAKRQKYRPMQRTADTVPNAQELIEQWYETNGKIAMPLYVDAIRGRQEAAYEMFLRDNDVKFNKATTIRKHARIFKQSEIQSRRDLDAAMEIFAKADRRSRQSHRAIAVEMALNNYRQAERIGELTEMNKATKIYIEATGVDKDDPNIPKAEDFKMPILEMADELTRLLMEHIAKKAMQGNALDLQNLKVIDLIEGIDFTTIDQFAQLPAADAQHK